MPASETAQPGASARALTIAAYTSFVPIGIATVLLGPMLPLLSARWSLNYSQAGLLFNVQYFAATLAVALSGFVVSRRGYRFAMKAGLVCVAAGLALLWAGSRWLGMLCIASYGAGLGLAVPAANLLVAEVNPHRRGASLNLLNFCWSAGAVACPFLVAEAAKRQWVPLFLGLASGFALLVAVGIAAMRSTIVEPASGSVGGRKVPVNWKHRALPALAGLFFAYVGTENGFGLWVASYAKSLSTITPATALMTPSFFYASLMLGRWLVSFLLRTIDEIRVAQVGLVVACAGMAGLVLSHDLPGVAASACLAGLGLSGVYPITIALLSREFGPTGSKVASFMFTLSNIGGGVLPWLVGVASTRFATLKAGLAVPLIGSTAMFLLYLRDWNAASAVQPAQAAQSGTLGSHPD